MKRGLRIRTPAKLNLGLALVGLRSDGYHLLESVFAPIEVFDELTLEVDPGVDGPPGPPGVTLECHAPLDPDLPEAVGQVPSGPENLAWRAARRFCDETGFAAAIRIGLRKGIPAGAGLGGGSSDAAAVLRGLDRLSGLAIDASRLAAMALSLGADVPFFLAPAPSFVAGIGERITPLDRLPRLPLVVVNPGKTLATAAVYRETDRLAGALTKNRAGSTMRALSGLTQDLRSAEPALRDLLVNDLEPAARRLCPAVARIADRLARVGAIGVSMTGSGATVFGVFESEAAAEAAAIRLRDEAPDGPPPDEGGERAERCWVRATRTLAREPGAIGGFEEFLGASPNG